jgi:hypothetical protein
LERKLWMSLWPPAYIVCCLVFVEKRIFGENVLFWFGFSFFVQSLEERIFLT